MVDEVVGLGTTLTTIATALMLQAAEDYTTLAPRSEAIEDSSRRNKSKVLLLTATLAFGNRPRRSGRAAAVAPR